MEKNNVALSQEQISALFCAVNEMKSITNASLLQEIEPLIRDYFHGEVALGNDCITVRLLNGQQFLLTAAAA